MNRSTVPGALDLTALARMHFYAMSRADQVAAIRRMAREGQGPRTIAAATGWTVETVAQALADQERA